MVVFIGDVHANVIVRDCLIGCYTAVGVGQVIFQIFWVSISYHLTCLLNIVVGGGGYFWGRSKIVSFICSYRVYNPQIDHDVSEAALDSFCGDKSRDFLQFPRFFSKFRGFDNATNLKQILCHRIKLKKLVD